MLAPTMQRASSGFATAKFDQVLALSKSSKRAARGGGKHPSAAARRLAQTLHVHRKRGICFFSRSPHKPRCNGATSLRRFRVANDASATESAEDAQKESTTEGGTEDTDSIVDVVPDSVENATPPEAVAGWCGPNPRVVSALEMPCDCTGGPDCVAVLVRFRWLAGWGGNEVLINGSFNEWAEPIPVPRIGNGDFVLCVTLQPGTYQYKFCVDGQWLVSLEEAQVIDESGKNTNNQVTVVEAVTFRWKKEWGGDKVLVSGTDSNWTEQVELERDENDDFVLRKSLMVGTYQYKFLVDEVWRCSPEEPTVRNAKNMLNNQ
ncbi:hypothetical protein CYMTET_45606, partial [Cymbomonas tetramitiformis]